MEKWEVESKLSLELEKKYKRILEELNCKFCGIQEFSENNFVIVFTPQDPDSPEFETGMAVKLKLLKGKNNEEIKEIIRKKIEEGRKIFQEGQNKD